MAKTKLGFNPISGTIEFIQVETRIQGRVSTFADLPAATGTAGEIYIVEQDTGSVLLFNKREAGLYRSNGTSWEAYTDISSQSIEVDDTNIGSGSTNLQAALDHIAAQAASGNQLVSGQLTNSNNTLELTLQDTTTVDIDVSALNIDTGLLSTDIDTLSKLNTILTDATLIDTTDPRLSDSRTPLSHTHVEADITDLDKYTQAEVDSAIAIVQTDIDNHELRTDNPHLVTSTQVGLGNVDNTSDANKPVSTAQQTALDLKANDADISTVGKSNDYNDLDNLPTITAAPVDSVNGQTGVVVLDKDDVGLDQVDNTSDANKPISTATQTALDNKANSSHTHTKSEITDFSDADYATAAQGALADTAVQTETDPIFTASEANNFVAGDKANLDNQSGTNTGDETTATIQSKRPLKTVGGVTLEGTGDIALPSAPVDSVNGQTGVVVIDADDIDDSTTTNKFATAAELTQIATNTSDISTIQGEQTAQDAAIALNTAKISATGNELEASDIDTLAELNAVITDATLIDTTDSRLSDARTPLAHSHVVADITDFATGVLSTVLTGLSLATNTAVTAADSILIAIGKLQAQITDLITGQSTQDAAIALNTAKVSADGSIDTHSDVDVTTVAPTTGDVLEFDGTNFVPAAPSGGGAGIASDPDPQTNLAGTATLNDLVLNTTTGQIEKFDGTDFVQLTNDAEEAGSVAAGSTLGLQQELLANAGQPGLTVLAVGYTDTGKVQGVSLGDGNVIQIYENGADFNAGIPIFDKAAFQALGYTGPEFMSQGEPICFTDLPIGAIITSTQGFYGVSEQLNGANESPMPLLSYGLSFKSTFLNAFRSSNTNTNDRGFINVVNGPLPSKVTLTRGDGTPVNTLAGAGTPQTDLEVGPWEYLQLQTDANAEFILSSTNNIMACIHGEMRTVAPQYHDSRLVMPLTNDGITWPRSGFISAPFNNTQVDFWVRDGAEGRINSTLGTGVSPGSPVDFDAAIGVGTGAADQDYEPDGATRVKAIGLISAYSGADSAGLEASPLMPTTAMSQILPQPLFIDDVGDGGNSGIAIASPYEGTARVYEWNTTTNQLDLAYTVPLTRNIGGTTTRDDQNHPAAGAVMNDAVSGVVTLVGDLGPGVIIADVPITVIVQNGTATQGPANTIRSQGGTTTTGIVDDDDETLMLGITPETIAVEIREDADGVLRKRVISNTGAETWEIA